MEKQPCVYLLASHCNGTLYVGVTSNLIKRVYEHRNGRVDSFRKRFAVHTLVWYEIHEGMESAILREKQIKKWTRKAKIGLIEQHNPTWQDLWPELMSPSLDSGNPCRNDEIFQLFQTCVDTYAYGGLFSLPRN